MRGIQLLYAHVCLCLSNVSVLPCKGRLGVCKVAIHGSNALLLLRPGLTTTHRVFKRLLPLLSAKLGLGLKPALLVGWPTAEFGAMGFEGAVKITHKAELEAIPDKKERLERERELADGLRAHNTALGLAGRYELDDVIDPADTREVVIRFLSSLPPVPLRTGRKRTIDNW